MSHWTLPGALIDMQPFQTPRLDLRPIAEGDEALYCGLYTDPEVMRHIAAPLSVDAAQRAFAAVLRQSQLDDPPLRLWILSERASGSEIGILALIRHRDEAHALELGAMLHLAWRDQGLAAEALALLVETTFRIAPGCLLWTRHAPDNAAAAGLMRKLGFQRRNDSTDTINRWQVARDRWRAGGTIPNGVAELALDR